jgi:hypothetical protein
MSMGSVQPGNFQQQPPTPQQPGYNAITDYSMGFGRIAQQPSFGSFYQQPFYQQPFYQQPFYQPPMAPQYGYGMGMQYGGMPQDQYGQQMPVGLGSFVGQYQNPMTRSVRRGFGGQGGFGGFNPMMGMGLGSFDRFVNQFGPQRPQLPPPKHELDIVPRLLYEQAMLPEQPL